VLVFSRIVPASILVTSLGAIGAYTFLLLGKVFLSTASDENSKPLASLSEAWTHYVGPSSAWMVTIACIIIPFGTTLSYAMILGDSVSGLIQAAGLRGLLATRNGVILSLTFGLLYPLCRLPSLSALAPLSMMGLAGVGITGLFMLMRLLPGGGYTMPDGMFLQSLSADSLPSFGQRQSAFSVFSPCILASTVAFCYCTHFFAGDFLSSLGSKWKSYKQMSLFGFSSVAVINVIIMSLGFLTFGASSFSCVLNNYASHDKGAFLCQFLLVVSIVGAYPIMVHGIRSAITPWFWKGENGEVPSVGFDKGITKLIVAPITVVSLLLKNPGFVVSFNGAVAGSAVLYLFPGILYLRATDGLERTRGVMVERVLSRLLIVLGVFMTIVGGSMSVLEAFFPAILR